MAKQAFYAAAWGVVAAAIAYWLNGLAGQHWNEFQHLVFVAPVIEETAKYLGIRAARRYSLLIPAVFVVAEMVMRQTVPTFMGIAANQILAASFLSLLIGLFTLQHFLFYAIIYSFGYKLWALPIAMAFHSVWNLYTVSPPSNDALPLALVAIGIVVFPATALWRYGRSQELMV